MDPAIRCRTLVLAAALMGTMPGVLLGQRGDSTIPSTIRERIVTDVASRWSTPSRDIAVDWEALVLPDPVQPADAIQLRGDGNNGWFLLVVDPAGRQPFSMRLHAGRIAALPVATRHLRRDDVLKADDIAYVTDTIWGPPPMEELLAQPGWRVRRNVRMGAPLVPPVVMPPPLIELGDGVEVVWRRGEAAISIEGPAIQSARQGDRIRVRLTEGRGTVRGIAVGPGLAEMERSIR